MPRKLQAQTQLGAEKRCDLVRRDNCKGEYVRVHGSQCVPDLRRVLIVRQEHDDKRQVRRHALYASQALAYVSSCALVHLHLYNLSPVQIHELLSRGALSCWCAH